MQVVPLAELVDAHNSGDDNVRINWSRLKFQFGNFKMVTAVSTPIPYPSACALQNYLLANISYNIYMLPLLNQQLPLPITVNVYILKVLTLVGQ